MRTSLRGRDSKSQWHSGWEEFHEAFGKTFLNEVLNFRNVINAPPETTGARTRRRKLGAPD